MRARNIRTKSIGSYFTLLYFAGCATFGVLDMNSETADTKKSFWFQIGILVIVSTIAYLKVFNASFLSWDDGAYVLYNKDITGFTAKNISAWFSEYYVGNYHPVTMASYAIDHVLGGLQPQIYHISNLLLHITNASLVFILMRKIGALHLPALAVALLFALHPSQAESVAWVAERKTVLSALFSLLALIFYTEYATTGQRTKMICALLAATVAMLSKATAVVIPVSFIAVDIWLKRDILSFRVWREKLLLLGIATVVGIVAINAQAGGKFLDARTGVSTFQSIVYAGYAYSRYIVRLFLPFQLSAMYPYPDELGMIHYVFCIGAFCLVGLIYVAWRRKWYVLCGGLLFYTANIVLVLQLIPFGEALMADRYMYIACIGILYPAMQYFFGWVARATKPIVGWGILAVVTAACLLLTFARNTAWQSDTNFFNAMLEAFPNSAVAQYSVGGMYLKNGDFANAEVHLNKAVRLDPGNYKAWYNKGTLHLRQGKAMEALEALDKSISINGYHKAYFSRAILHQATGQPELALADIEQVLKVQPHHSRALCIKGDCLERAGKLKEALENYSKAIENDPAESIFYMHRGIVFGKTQQYKLAIGDLDLAIELNPESGEAFYYRAMIKQQTGQGPCSDLETAVRKGYSRAREAMAKLCRN
jgi:tetratricopeptide (TPR) repeat protein